MNISVMKLELLSLKEITRDILNIDSLDYSQSSLNATPVSYEGSQILKATASFHYDRYYSGQSVHMMHF